ncbi:hypothetical protein EC973_009477, partial [Apophysomyces ossiformis]
MDAKGRNLAEDVPAMSEKYPFWNDYWEDKAAKLEKINVPTYILASYSTQLHTAGSIRAFTKINTDKKWLRVHPYFEWYDLYKEDSDKDLARFFDHYLKGHDNGWEATPSVRLTLLGFNQPSVIQRAESEYPLARTRYVKYYLDSSSSTANNKANDIEVGKLLLADSSPTISNS